jgi:hypothetical protein
VLSKARSWGRPLARRSRGRSSAESECAALVENAHHEEHHLRPQIHWTQIHWTQIPALRPQLPASSERRVGPWAHGFGFDPIVQRFSMPREGEQRRAGWSRSMPASA